MAVRLIRLSTAGACLNWGAVVLVSAAPIPGLFNTGVDSGGNLLPDGAIDPHYTLVASDDPHFQGPNAFTLSKGFALGWMPEGPFSRWIGPAADQTVVEGEGFYD
jgi:hypothetical protein